MIGSVLNSGLSGIQTGYNTLEKGADQAAKLNLPGGKDDYLMAIVDQIDGEIQVKASANVVGAANETLGTLIDIEV